MNLVKIECQVDVTNPEHLEALNTFLSNLGETATLSAPVKSATFKTAPKKALKKVEDIDVKDAENVSSSEIEEIDIIEPVSEKEISEAETGATEEEVRKALSLKVKTYRTEIRAKLGELGAENISTLDKKHYGTILNFLNELE